MNFKLNAIAASLCSAVQSDTGTAGGGKPHGKASKPHGKGKGHGGKGSPQSALSPERMEASQRAAENANAKAGFSAEGYGKSMAEKYLANLGAAAGTWQEGVIHLLKTTNDTQQEKAMSAALKVAAEEKDGAAEKNLRKRISEARRIFKASRNDFTATLKIMEGAGSWHQKVAQMPKAATTGRKKDNGAGKSSAVKIDAKAISAKVQSIVGKDAPKATVTKLAEYVAAQSGAAVKAAVKAAELPKAGKDGAKHGRPDVGAIVGEIKKLSFTDLRTVCDVVLFQMSLAKGKLGDTAKASMNAFAELDNAAVLSKTGTE